MTTTENYDTSDIVVVPDDEEVAKPIASDELDTFDPNNTVVELESGLKVEIQDLKTRQFFKLLRIVTRGTGSFLADLSLNSGDSQDEFVGKLVAMVLFAIPEAEDEAIDFILSMVEPIGLRSGRKLSNEDKAHNQTITNELYAELYNPELGDLVTIIETIVRREAADIQSLGKRLMKMLDLAKKTGQLSTETS